MSGECVQEGTDRARSGLSQLAPATEQRHTRAEAGSSLAATEGFQVSGFQALGEGWGTRMEESGQTQEVSGR